MNIKIGYIKITIFAVICIGLNSCAALGEGMLAAMQGYGYGYGGYGAYSSFGGGTGNMNYLLDPNYAIAQTNASMGNYRNISENMAINAKNQIEGMMDYDYSQFTEYNKKPDGSNYTKQEWMALAGSAATETNGGGSFSSDNTSSRSSSQSISSSVSQSGKCPYCNNTGQIIIEQPVATYGHDNSRYCNDCRKTTLSGYTHSHHSCRCGRARTSGNIPVYERMPW